jgi:hypothetical protein
MVSRQRGASASTELFFGIVFLVVIVVIGMWLAAHFAVKTAPKEAKKVSLPQSVSTHSDGCPVYRVAVNTSIPFSRRADDFVFAEIITDAEYKSADGHKWWSQVREGKHYPSISPPLNMSIRKNGLGNIFNIPVQELNPNTKYWLRFGKVEFVEPPPNTYPDELIPAIGRFIDRAFGTLYLPFLLGSVQVWPGGEWSQYAPFRVGDK